MWLYDLPRFPVSNMFSIKTVASQTDTLKWPLTSSNLRDGSTTSKARLVTVWKYMGIVVLGIQITLPRQATSEWPGKAPKHLPQILCFRGIYLQLPELLKTILISHHLPTKFKKPSMLNATCGSHQILESYKIRRAVAIWYNGTYAQLTRGIISVSSQTLAHIKVPGNMYIPHWTCGRIPLLAHSYSTSSSKALVEKNNSLRNHLRWANVNGTPNHTLNIVVFAGLCLVWSCLTLNTNRFVSSWKASTHDCEYQIIWKSLDVTCGTSINHLMDTEYEFSPCDLCKAHILMSTPEKTAKKSAAAQKRGGQLKARRLLKV